MRRRGRPRKAESIGGRKTAKPHPMMTRRSSRRTRNFDAEAATTSQLQAQPCIVDTNFQIKIEHDENNFLSCGPGTSFTTPQENLTFHDARKPFAEVINNTYHGDNLSHASTGSHWKHLDPKNVTIPEQFDDSKSSNSTCTGSNFDRIPSLMSTIIIKQENFSPRKDWIQIVSVSTAAPAIDSDRVEERMGTGNVPIGDKFDISGPIQKKPRLSSFAPMVTPRSELGLESSNKNLDTRERLKQKMTTPIFFRFFECPKCCQEFEDRTPAETHFQKCGKTFNFNKSRKSMFLD